MTIGEVARRAGIRPSALRYYESAGVMPKPERENGRRRYRPEVLELLAVVRVAQQAGFTIAEIRTLLHGFAAETPPSERWRELASKKLPEVDALIRRALGMKRLLEWGLRCDCLRLEDCALVRGEDPTRQLHEDYAATYRLSPTKSAKVRRASDSRASGMAPTCPPGDS